MVGDPIRSKGIHGLNYTRTIVDLRINETLQIPIY